MFMLFLKEIRHRWIIHLLVISLMAFIVSILVIQSSINSSAEEKIKELSHELGQSMLVVPEGTDLEAFYSMRYGPEGMPDDYGERIKASPAGRHAKMIEPRLYGNISIDDRDLIIAGQKVRSAKNGDYNFTAIGSGVSRELGLKAGDTLDVKGKTLRVVKVIDPPPKGYDMALFMPLVTAQQILDKPGKINALNMGGCWCELDIPGFAAQVEKTLPGTMAITVDGMAEAQIQINSVMERYSVVLWITGIILVTGSIVFLILYIIKKGEREIGLLLSIGLSPVRIIARNIIVSVITALSGALLGYLLSMPLMSWFGRAFLRIGLAPSWEYLPHFLSASVIIALIASSFPSLFITRLDPARLLREE